jgi:hypothetical protein
MDKGTTNNPSGRPKGIPNKVTSTTRDWVQKLISDNQKGFEADLKSLEARDRLIILEKMMQYCIPKMQAIDVTAQIKAEYEALERLLDKATPEVIDQITERILKLKEAQNGNG